LYNYLALGKFTPISFSLGQNIFDRGYYSGDDIYPKCSTTIKTFSNPLTSKVCFNARRMGENIERAFKVLQARFVMISNLCRP